MIKEPKNPIPYRPMPPGLAYALTAPLRAYFQPIFIGLENVKKSHPCLYVGNHTIFGGIDWPIIAAELYQKRGVALRSLADRAHFKVPVWRRIVPPAVGIVHGTPQNCRRLMRSKQHILVYPGGSREICKRKGEQNRLVWKQRTGFARMAIENRYDILPFASLGTDDMFTILWDADDIMRSPLGWVMKKTGFAHRWLRDGDVIPPIVRGIGPTLIPRPERMYFAFGKPIPTRRYFGKQDNEKALWRLRDECAEAVEGLMRDLIALRKRDRSAGPVRKLLTQR